MPEHVEMILPAMIAAGMETLTYRLVLALAGRGWSVGVTCLIEDGEMAAELREHGVRVRTVEEPGFAANLRPVRLAAWLREVRPEVVHVHSGAWIKGAHAARLAGVRRVVFTEHGLLPQEPWYSSLLKRWGAAYCDRVVAVSQPLCAYLRRVGVPAGKLSVIVNGVDTSRFAPGPGGERLRQEFGIGRGFLVGHVARLAPEKDQHHLLLAFAALLRELPEAHLMIAGDGPLRESLVKQAGDLGLTRCVHFAGIRRDMPDVYRAFDVFVLPSLAEGTSMSILEAMASGCAVVATPVGGTPALLDDGRCGVLVSPGDPVQLAMAVRDLLGDRARRAQLGLLSRERAVASFSEDRMVERYIEVYRSPSIDVERQRDPCAA